MNFDKLTAFLDDIPRYSAPGVDCIVKQGYEVIYRHRAGFSDREHRLPMGGSEQVWLYSMTKPITVAAVLHLVEAGQLSLQDRLADFFPAFSRMQVRQGDTLVPAKAPITVEHLMTMQAGFDYDLETPAIRDLQKKTQGRFPTPSIAEALARQPLLYEPGTAWCYSLCHDVLAAVAEQAAGIPFRTLVQEAILDPLGMDHSTFRPDPAALAPQYQLDPMTGNPCRLSADNAYRLGSDYDSGGAGLASTLEDYSLFAAAMANGGVGQNGVRILKAETIEEMRRGRPAPGQLSQFRPWPQLAGYSYGLGVRTMTEPQAIGSRAPVGEFGWCGAAGSYLLLDPSRKLSLVYLQHMLSSPEPYIHPRLRELVYLGLEA